MASSPSLQQPSLSFSIAAFVLTSAYVLISIKREAGRKSSTEEEDDDDIDDRPHDLHLAESQLTKDEVVELRLRHFSRSVSVSYSNSGPLMIMEGSGSFLIDETGQRYLDTRNNVAHVGHEHPHVVSEIQRQVATLNTNTRYLHPNVSLLAQRLTALLPDPLEVVFFVNSGSEANDMALRLARAYSGSRNTICVDHAYHGHTLAVLEVSPYKWHSKELTLSKPTDDVEPTPGKYIFKVPCPDTYRGKHRCSGPDQLDECGKRYAKYVEEACRKHFANNVGAFIVEGGMSVAGVILPPPNYLELSAAAVRASGGLYIADEVQTGLGRLGTSMWAFQHGGNNVVPDVVTIGKPFGNGMPLGAVVTTREVARAFESMGVEYFNTFAGSPVCAAAGLSVLELIERERLQERAQEVGSYLRNELMKLKANQPLVGDIRGAGMFLGIEFVRDHTTLEPATEETSYICTRLKTEHRVLSSIDGPNDNVLVVKPPLTFSKKDADYFVSCIHACIISLNSIADKSSITRTPT